MTEIIKKNLFAPGQNVWPLLLFSIKPVVERNSPFTHIKNTVSTHALL